MSEAEAKDPQTSAARLIELARDKALAPLVAENPSTPKDLLLQLMAKFPHAVLLNPAFDLLSLENPTFLQQAPMGSVQSLVQVEGLPLWCFASLMDGAAQNIIVSLLKNPSLPAALLSRLARHKDIYVRRKVAESHHIDIEAQRLLANDTEESVRQDLAENPVISEEVVDLLLQALDPYRKIRGGLTRHPRLSEAILLQLADGASDDQMDRLAYNPSTPAHLLELWAKRGPRLLRMVAFNPNTPTELLEMSFSANHDEWFHRRVAAHPNVSLDLLTALAADASEAVAAEAASNPRAPLALLWSLSQAGSQKIKIACASNPSATTELLEALYNRKSKTLSVEIAKHANASVSLLERLSVEGGEPARHFVAAHEKTPREVQLRLQKDPGPHVRRAVAERRDASLEQLQALAFDPVGYVRLGVIANSLTPSSLLEQLSQDGGAATRWAARVKLAKAGSG